MSEHLTAHDDREMFCRLYGRDQRFRHCRTINGAPCPKILDCWIATFDVVAFLRRHLSDEELMAAPTRPTPKIPAGLDHMHRPTEAPERTLHI